MADREWQPRHIDHRIRRASRPLSVEEREHVIETTVKAVRGRVPIVAGTGTNNIDETIRLTQFAEKVGADASLMMVPYYNRPSQEGLYQYFTSIAEQVSLPIIIYNIPGRTAPTWSQTRPRAS